MMKRFCAVCLALVILFMCASESALRVNAVTLAAPGKPSVTTLVHGCSYKRNWLFGYYEYYDKDLSIRWSKVAGADGYEVSYTVNNSSKPVIVTVKDAKYVLSVRTPFYLPLGGKVQVKVRAYAIENGMKVYSGWSKSRTVYY